MEQERHGPAPTAGTPQGPATAPAPERTEISAITGADRYRIALFADCLEFQGGEGSRGVWGSIPLAAITGVGVEVRAKDRGLLIWGILGLVAAFGIYQVATNPNVANLGAFAVAAISGILLIQYYFRPPGLQLVVYAGGSSRAIPLKADSLPNARAFATDVIRARDESIPSQPQEPARSLPRYPMA
ncbi:MAG: hypothetical protein HY678_01740 [Chloroflexi bacterium]|nr:hypothetical protein [Chloroflexota bacterium]